MGWILTAGGYVGNVPVQIESATLGIRLIFTIIPAILILSLLVILKNYQEYPKQDNNTDLTKNKSIA
jgi:Na+/melibiose symporter-like transporter